MQNMCAASQSNALNRIQLIDVLPSHGKRIDHQTVSTHAHHEYSNRFDELISLKDTEAICAQ